MTSTRTNSPAPSVRSTELSGADFRWVARAIKSAEQSRMKVRVGACVVVAGRASGGHNRYRNPPHISYLDSSIHAEISALRNAVKKGAGGTIYVARIGQTGRLLPSFPCRRCVPKLRDAGIKRIIWWDGHCWVATKVSQLFFAKT